MVPVVDLEAEGFFDTKGVHGDMADAVHQAEAVAAQVQPEFVGFAVGILVGPVDLGDSQYVFVPDAGRVEAEAVLQQTDGFGDHVVGGHQYDRVVKQRWP